MYELLFRSRWYALIWALFMAASAIMFTTTGAGAWLTSTQSESQTSREAREGQFRKWAEDDRRRSIDDQGYDPSSPDRVRDGTPGREDLVDPSRRPAPFAADDTDDAPADGADSP
ncbi:hypothetical protein AQZ52_04655 [Novosphingobium fuchskuhlense]|uniref:Uncharacterized protein n=1 Tax=Novosphingobium fuchskuhlense TaxID=1117702 RepID=A0A117UX96_9SPHN|nr:hypothetical protein [Novosphingobium fuchskuhlense]KUR72538.1 hypothetical protein AQZ52_04655 [Novosphingobium fuchskuhlense]